MNNRTLRRSLLFGLGFSALCLAPGLSAVSPEYQMLGLAVHQETGRNIYLGAIHLGGDAPKPENLFQASAPRLMEYRVIIFD